MNFIVVTTSLNDRTIEDNLILSLFQDESFSKCKVEVIGMLADLWGIKYLAAIKHLKQVLIADNTMTKLHCYG